MDDTKQMEKRTRASDIGIEVLSPENLAVYVNRIQSFDCDYEGINIALRNAHTQDVTTILAVNTVNGDIMGFCSYCCASLKVGDTVYPAIEGKSFGVDIKYQDYYLQLDGTHNADAPLCAAYLFGYFFSHLDMISRTYVCARYFVFNSRRKNDVVKFYKKCGCMNFGSSALGKPLMVRERGEEISDYFMFREFPKII